MLRCNYEWSRINNRNEAEFAMYFNQTSESWYAIMSGVELNSQRLPGINQSLVLPSLNLER